MYHSVKLYYPLLWLAIIILSATFASPEPGLRSKPEDEQEQFEEGDDIIGKHDKRSEESEPVELLDLEQPTSPKPKLLPEPRPGNETLYKTKCCKFLKVNFEKKYIKLISTHLFSPRS